jgi:hypothetical protein
MGRHAGSAGDFSIGVRLPSTQLSAVESDREKLAAALLSTIPRAFIQPSGQSASATTCHGSTTVGSASLRSLRPAFTWLNAGPSFFSSPGNQRTDSQFNADDLFLLTQLCSLKTLLSVLTDASVEHETTCVLANCIVVNDQYFPGRPNADVAVSHVQYWRMRLLC